MTTTSALSAGEGRSGADRDRGQSHIDPALTAMADVSLLLDEQGVVREIGLGSVDLPLPEAREWLGKRWIDTVTPESRPTLEELLAEALRDGRSRRRLLTHPSQPGSDVPISYSVIRVNDRLVIALGRDLRTVAALERRLVEAEQVMERDYLRLRHLETRARALFQLSSDAVLVLDGVSLKVVDANPAAAELLQTDLKNLIGRSCPFALDGADGRVTRREVAALRGWTRAGPVAVRVRRGGRGGNGEGGKSLVLGLSLFSLDPDGLVLARLWPAGRAAETQGLKNASRTFQLVQALPDGFVITDLEGRVRCANRSFLTLVELRSEDQSRGHFLGRWLGRPGAEAGLLLAALRRHGAVKLFGSALRGECGSVAEVEVSGAVSDRGQRSEAVFIIRDVGRRLVAGSRGGRDLGRAVDDLADQVGRTPVRQLAREAADLVERRLLEAALTQAADNRTVAAELLGLSRQSLYLKLKRYGFK
jgi:transcriptional regulator PpsR